MDTLQFVPVLVVGFGASLGLTPLSRTIAMRLGVVDQPSARKIHLDRKPLMGGLAIYVGFVVSLLLFSVPQHLVELGAIVAGATMLAIIGFMDDRKDLSPRVRLSVMTAAALLTTLVGIQIRLFGTPLIDIPITVFWIVALINAINWLDNMDGLAAGAAAIAAGFFMLIAITQGQILVSMMAAALFGSAIGFLTYNFNPSSTFMGDMGAYTLGYIVALLGIKLNFGAQPLNVTWMVPILVLALPVIDINLAILTRLIEGRSPMEAGKDHTSHRIMALGFSQRMTLLLLYGFCMLFGTIGLIVTTAPPETALSIGIFGLLVMAVVFGLLMIIRRRYQLHSQ